MACHLIFYIQKEVQDSFDCKFSAAACVTNVSEEVTCVSETEDTDESVSHVTAVKAAAARVALSQ